jgi:hypothetical protein
MLIAPSVQAPENPVARLLITLFPERFQLVYQAPHGHLKIYKIIPAAYSEIIGL